jgi:hypothetical protein
VEGPSRRRGPQSPIQSHISAGGLGKTELLTLVYKHGEWILLLPSARHADDWLFFIASME